MSDSFQELKKEAKAELESAGYLYKKARRGFNELQKEQADVVIHTLKNALKHKDETELKNSLDEYLEFKRQHFSGIRVNKTWETIKELLWILLVVFMIRWIFIEPFRIPSGSMIPTLLVGDQLMVNKLVYGAQIPLTTRKLFDLKKPKRGDIIVFKFPPDPGEDYVKRVVGLAGDEVWVRNGVLLINGKEVPREFVEPYTGPNDTGPCPGYDLYLEKLDGRQHDILLCHVSHENDNYGPVKVPEGMVFGMGDNRDNSADSRVWGTIPVNNIKGKALIIHLPLDPTRHYFPRWDRFFKIIK